MKKILIFLSILFLMSGCGDNNEKLTCSSKSTANGMTTNTDYKIEYKDNEVKFVTITYDYIQDENNNTDNTTQDIDTTADTTTGETNSEIEARDNSTTTNTTDDTDGINADSDGITTDDNNESNSDDVVDGVVGDTIDGAIDGVTDTILDIAGIKDTYENQINSYGGIEGF